MNNNSLIFFTKEGYPHNFQYNTDTEVWEGKILFDENSDQTFKTQSLYIFEDVPSIDFDANVNLITMNYNNDSGLTIAGETNFSNELISNIIKSNESQDFYSKWIYGSDFNKKFPLGTVIYFSVMRVHEDKRRIFRLPFNCPVMGINDCFVKLCALSWNLVYSNLRRTGLDGNLTFWGSPGVGKKKRARCCLPPDQQ